MSAPRLASSVRKNIIKIRIKMAEKKRELKKVGTVLRSTKEELHPNSSPDVKPHESTCCSFQVAREAPEESPTRILELMTAYPLIGKPMHSPLKSRISSLSSKMGKLPPIKRPIEGIIVSDRYQKRRKLIDDSMRMKGMGSDGNRTQETISSMSGSSDSHQILTSSGSSCVLVGQKKGKIGDSIDVPKANEYEQSSLLLNEACDFKHRADRLKREGEKALSTILYLGAVLKFLRVASLWEHEPGVNNEAAVHLYLDTAKLCQYCAAECNKQNNIPVVALAYKALELIHMRIAFLRSPAIEINEAFNLASFSSLFPQQNFCNKKWVMGDAMTSAFEATMRYQILMHSKELTTPIVACINIHFINVNAFIEMAHRALDSTF